MEEVAAAGNDVMTHALKIAATAAVATGAEDRTERRDNTGSAWTCVGGLGNDS